MATYDLTKKTYGVSGQSKVILGNTNNESGWKRLQNLENKVEEQSDKLDQITSLLNEISKRHQLLEIISEYKSDKSALAKQIDDLKRQLDEAESRIKRLLIRCEQFAEDNNTTEE